VVYNILDGLLNIRTNKIEILSVKLSLVLENKKGRASKNEALPMDLAGSPYWKALELLRGI
jgi:hypothetical protein